MATLSLMNCIILNRSKLTFVNSLSLSLFSLAIMNPFIVPSAWTWHYVAGRYRGEWPARRRWGVMGIAGGVDFVLNLRSDPLVAAMVICGSWEPTSRRRVRARGGEMSLAIPRRDTGHATAPAQPPSDVHCDTPSLPETPRLSSKGGAHKRTYAGTRGAFTTAAERIALTRKNPAVPHEEEYWQTARK